MVIRVYTDGGCLKNKVGACGFVAVRDSAKDQTVFVKRVETHEETTSNKMELQAMVNATGYFVEAEEGGSESVVLEFCSDSRYVVNGINNRWYDTWKENDFKKANGYPVKNIELWKELMTNVDYLKSMFAYVNFIWVRGKDSQGNGDGDIYNEMVDELVSDKLKESEK